MTDPELVDENSFLWLAYDIPAASPYAEALVAVRPAIARELLAARRSPDGMKLQYPDQRLLNEMRELGLCAEDRSSWYLSNFALLVRNRLVASLRSGQLRMNVFRAPPEDVEEAAE